MLDEAVDLLGQFFDAGEGAAPDGFLGDDAEPALDLIEPRGIGRCEVDVVARAFGEPGFDLGVFVGGVVVEDDVSSRSAGTALSMARRKPRSSWCR